MEIFSGYFEGSAFNSTRLVDGNGDDKNEGAFSVLILIRAASKQLWKLTSYERKPQEK